ncbi:MAG TPA: hypothetical protein VF335_04690, partial [Chitinivibrionales bacterium]
MDIAALTIITRFLKHYRRTHTFLRLFESIAGFFALCCILLSVIQVLFALLPLTLFLLAWNATILLFSCTVLALIAHYYLLHFQSLLDIAAIIEKQRGLTPRWLSLSLELQAVDALGSSLLKGDVAVRAASWVARNSASKPTAFSKKAALLAAASLTVWASASIFVKPHCAAFWDAPLSFGSRISAKIVPGSATLPMHASIQLRCIPKAASYPSCRVVLRDLGSGSERSRLLRADSGGAFQTKCENLSRSFSYRFSIGMTTFPPETVQIAPPPSLFGMRIRVTPPPYSGLAPMLLTDGQGSFSALAGSKAAFSISSLSALSRAVFCPSPGETVSCRVKGIEAFTEITVRRACAYSFALVDTFGQKSDSTPPFFIDLTADMPPSIQFIKPGKNLALSPALAETLRVEAHDDIGISQCTFQWRKSGEPSPQPHSLSLFTAACAQTFVHRELAWDLRELSLYPGDTVFYWAYVRDNDPFDTSHHCATDTFWLRLPSFDEIHERMANQENITDQSLQSAHDRQDLIKSKLGDLLKSTRGKESLSWEQKQILSDLKENLKAQSDTLTKAIESLNRTVEQLKQQGLSSRDLLDKMDKIKKALEDIARQYGDSVLFEPPRKDESLSADDLKNALNAFKKALPDLAKQLDNALKYLDMLKQDQQLAEMARRAEQYGKQQQELSPDKPKPEIAFDRQKKLTKNMEDFLEELKQKSSAGAEKPLINAENLPALQSAQLQLQPLQNDVSENRFPSEESRQRMAANLFSLAQNLRDMQSSAMMRKLKKEQEALMDLAHDALSLASWQQELAKQQALHSPRSHLAKAQQSIKQALAKSAEKLDRLSLMDPKSLRDLMGQFSEAAGSMDKSLGELQNEQDAADALEGGERALNGLANSLLDAMNSMDGNEGQGQGEGMGEMMGGLKRLSGKQAMINSATGNLLRQMLSGQ